MKATLETAHLWFSDRARHRYRIESRQLRKTLQTFVPESGQLTRSVEALFAHQALLGVIQDDLHEVERFQLLDPSAPSRAFYFSLNPRRADRHRG
ncbi:MAG: hypothetical protein KDL87_06575, partial [Verrucomicrobiae bacterium]|nr:hypothetical protein [Verrucomicrobiae bacterium]